MDNSFRHFGTVLDIDQQGFAELENELAQELGQSTKGVKWLVKGCLTGAGDGWELGRGLLLRTTGMFG